jgi:hypothetical protein
MAALIFLVLNLGASLFKSQSRLGAENAALRQSCHKHVYGSKSISVSSRAFSHRLVESWAQTNLKVLDNDYSDSARGRANPIKYLQTTTV